MGCCQSRCLPFYRISNRMRKRNLCQNVINNGNSRCSHYCHDECANNYNNCFPRPIYSIPSHLPINCQQKRFHNHHQCPSSHCPNPIPMSFYYQQNFCPISNPNQNHLRNHFVNHSCYNKMQGSCCPSRPMYLDNCRTQTSLKYHPQRKCSCSIYP